MATLHRISNQERTTELSKGDLILVSHPLNPAYETLWKSYATSFETLESEIELLYRNENFKEEIDELYDISEKYLHSSNLTITFTSDNKILLKDDNVAFSEIDASLFVAHGILKDAYIKDNDLVIIFELHDGKEKKVTVPLSKFIDVYYAGKGLCCESKTFRIDESIVSLIGHLHSYNEISDLNDILDLYLRKNELKSAAYTLSTEYALSNHSHDDLYWTKNLTSSANQLSDAFKNIKIGDYLSANALDNLSGNWQNAWTRISAASNGLTSNIGSIAYKNELSTNDILGYTDTTYTAGNGLSISNKNEIILTAAGVSYDNIKQLLSNDGYCVIFRDWMAD